MFGSEIRQRGFKIVAATLIACGTTVAGSETTFGGNCGGHCQQMKVCGAMVKEKGLKEASARHEEFNKCMTDPHNYK